MTQQDFINRLLLYVSELSDRTSPEDQPEMMLVTGHELEQGVLLALEQCDMRLTPADNMDRLGREVRFLRGKLVIAEDAIKEAASRAHNRLATLHDMQPV